MAGNRQAAEALILDVISEMDNGGPNRGIWEKRFRGMDDAQFDEFMKDLDSGKQTLHMYVPNKAKHDVDVSRNMEIAEKLGHSFFERIWMTDPKTGQTMLTPLRYMTLALPIRRQEQTLEKKISIPENNRVIDDLTGQPTGASKGSAISFPEFQVLYSKNMDRSLEELFKVRGGDEKAFREHNRLIMQTGEGRLDVVAQTPTKVRSTQSLSIALKGMHMGTTL